MSTFTTTPKQVTSDFRKNCSVCKKVIPLGVPHFAYEVVVDDGIDLGMNLPPDNEVLRACDDCEDRLQELVEEARDAAAVAEEGDEQDERFWLYLGDRGVLSRAYIGLSANRRS